MSSPFGTQQIVSQPIWSTPSIQTGGFTASFNSQPIWSSIVIPDGGFGVGEAEVGYGEGGYGEGGYDTPSSIAGGLVSMPVWTVYTVK